LDILLKTDSNTANAASLIWHALHALPTPSSKVNWAGFYVSDPTTPNQLILGPFQGKVACQTIAFGKGVCGAAAQSQQTQLVPDVEKFPGHIACDGDSKSEIVVPIMKDGKVSESNVKCCQELTRRRRWPSSTLTALLKMALTRTISDISKNWQLCWLMRVNGDEI
jgi:hypothetical protein